MNSKNAARVVLLLFVFGSLAYILIDRAGQGAARPAELSDTQTDADVIVYFFFNDIRCASCLRLEAYALETLEQRFSAERASGRIQWRPLSMDAPGNEHFLMEFGLYSKSIVLVKMKNGEQVRWENLERIWDLVHDKPAYLDYIESRIRSFLQETS